ncbi:gluconokinase [uncultured Roseobacter sp.]|uniref:gluconokinase n=1 Tax=uncultured Roseobacter sp. TaxID=114847 RepID=UPI0026325430|nr:gluconokinase [uncultured Roseobacter sp.]
MSFPRYIVMGVSGCGKTSIGMAFAEAIGAGFIDGDDLHPEANVKKMARGEPLNDADRRPWLAEVAAQFRKSQDGLVIGCSALRRKYRDWLRDGAGGKIVFLHLSGTRDVIAERMRARKDHFMPLSLLDSQFSALEPPQADELSVTVDIDQSITDIVSDLTQKIEGIHV